MPSPRRPSPVQDLENRLNARWQHISDARALAIQTRTSLAQALRGADSEDSSIVVSGSLARNEFTPGSDIDWSLLIDGQADPDVIEILPRIEKVINATAAKPPGREGTFGTLAFSHELIHQIGGEDDTNRNTTRRILLLLESSPIGRPDAYERVVRSIHASSSMYRVCWPASIATSSSTTGLSGLSVQHLSVHPNASPVYGIAWS